ncbi:MetQ/NlpA family ABC transporter substrate-binding protein [Marinivivus vitaminiproducens]|uniref:MetQ/NlpA family ABC transporter substrate-binding protein n=1 Tax=Marinivivus vitaminiproducens TaxID=3035935 RepID=UPI00279DB324|nr:MetQ/NlpA family ABC transporter substrate-binding protein [Geminicoccaceae bacterium SCSIO 64248]
MARRSFSMIGRLSVLMILLSPIASRAESIKVGTTSGPHAEILDIVTQQAQLNDLDIEIVEFNDFVMPNEALASGDLQANTFQTRPFLENYTLQSGNDLIEVAKTYVLPMGFYSEKYDSFDEVPAGGMIAIQNDPTNAARALLLLQAEGIVTLRDGGTESSGVIDIESNPRRLTFVELEAAQLARTLVDVDVAAINTSYALKAGLNPASDPILREKQDSPYSNVIAIRRVDEDAPWVSKLITAYQSEAVRQFLASELKGAAVPAW